MGAAWRCFQSSQRVPPLNVGKLLGENVHRG
jgi:hypothetical protein